MAENLLIEVPSRVKDDIFERIKAAFIDQNFFTSLCEHKVKQIIKDVIYYDDIDKKTTKVLIERYFEEDSFKNLGESGENVLAQIKIIVTSCYVLFAYFDPRNQRFVWPQIQNLTHMYPQFLGQEPEELQLLLNFRNIMRIALLIVPSQKNKKFLLDIGGRLEGRSVYTEYITGSGQKDSVKKRLIIYYTEAKLNSPEATALYQLTFSRSTRGPTTTARDRPNANRRRVEELAMTPGNIELLSKYPCDPIKEHVIAQCGLASRPDPLLNVDPRIPAIIADMKRAFSDMWHFDLLMRLPLRIMIEQQLNLIDQGACNGNELVCVNEDNILRNTYRYELFQQVKELKRVWDKMRFVMTACKLYLLSDSPAAQQYRMPQFNFLFEMYPEFQTLLTENDGMELEYLLRFRNFMKLGCLVVPGHPKIFLLRVVERLEGADNQYITGKGQTEYTDRRVLVYERESGNIHATLPNSNGGTNRNIAVNNAPNSAAESFPSIAGQRRSHNADEDAIESKILSDTSSSAKRPRLEEDTTSSAMYFPSGAGIAPVREDSMAAWMAHGILRQESFGIWQQQHVGQLIPADIFHQVPPMEVHPASAYAFATAAASAAVTSTTTSAGMLHMLPPSDVLVLAPANGNSGSAYPFSASNNNLLQNDHPPGTLVPAIMEVAEDPVREDSSDDNGLVEEAEFEAVQAQVARDTAVGSSGENGIDLNHFLSSNNAGANNTSKPRAVMSRQMSSETTNNLLRHRFQQQMFLSRQSSGNYSLGDDQSEAFPDPVQSSVQRESSNASMPYLSFTEGSLLDFGILHGADATAGLGTNAAGAGGGAPPPLRIEKEFSVLPLNLHFQPLFSLPARPSHQLTSVQSSSSAAASAVQQPAPSQNPQAENMEMLDSVEMFNMPFTETIFGYFSFTETLQQQLDESIDRHAVETNQISEA